MNQISKLGFLISDFRLYTAWIAKLEPRNLKFKILILIFFISSIAFGQSKEIKSFTVESEIVSAYVDRADDFYLVLANGEIQKIDKDGNVIASTKHSKVPASFDPANGMRLFIYFRDNQHFSWLSPTLESRGYEELDSSWAIEPILVCPSGDFSLWILDAADWSLRKVNTAQSQIISEFIILKDIPNPKIKTMREYQNFLFLLDEEKGLLIFNSIGKLIQKIDQPNIEWFNFLGEELYYPATNGIEFFDLYSTEKRSMPVNSNLDFLLFTDERMLTVSNKKKVTIQEYRP